MPWHYWYFDSIGISVSEIGSLLLLSIIISREKDFFLLLSEDFLFQQIILYVSAVGI
jgi:hypothetical protein